MTVRELKKGDFFKLKENGSVLVRDEFDRVVGKYPVHYFDDVNHIRYLKGSTPVFVDFVF